MRRDQNSYDPEKGYVFPEIVDPAASDAGSDMHGPIAEKQIKAPAVYGAVNVDPWGQKRIGDWIQTHSGIKFHLLDPRKEDFLIDDIAHALSHICRFTGHVSRFYSVAEHSVRVAWRITETHPALMESEHWHGKRRVNYGEFSGEELAYAGLMHDATEAYLCDMARPFKQLDEFAFYRKAEDDLMVHLASAFGFKFPFHAAVKAADEVLLGTEARDLMGNPTDGWHFRYDHLAHKIRPWSPAKAKRKFLALYSTLNPFDGKKPRRFFFF